MTTFHRIFSGIVFAIVFCVGLFVNVMQPIIPWVLAMAAAIGTLEYFAMARKGGFSGLGAFVSSVAALISVALVAEGYHYSFEHLPSILAVTLVFSLGIHLKRNGRDRFCEHVAITFLGCFYVGLPLSMAAAILHGHDYHAYHSISRFLIAAVLLVVWASDVGAYFVGRAWGRHKLAPKLSPGKTVEGMIGGFGASILVAALLMIFWPAVRNVFHWGEILGLAVVFAPIGMIGDLAESALKREAGVKDSGIDITGHGGLLDIVDSLLFCLPLFFLHMKYLYPLLHSLPVQIAGQ